MGVLIESETKSERACEVNVRINSSHFMSHFQVRLGTEMSNNGSLLLPSRESTDVTLA